ncbi:unnamed protein product [Anisakis simplex]|uniref:Activated RNA polymerase II transcriptional coactivator p15 n=1 Tax=Anisakis simplex TaxID=6269 RepID=A0A0M3KEJ8_ANISI|nr:unnamed protein product [Anisakis simplex]
MSRNTQKSTPGSQECTAKKQQKAAASVKKTPMDQRSLEEVPKVKVELQQSAEVQQTNGKKGSKKALVFSKNDSWKVGMEDVLDLIAC